MSCCDVVCGTDKNRVVPGDPDNTLSISARGIVGAIEVSWNYPLINPHAVSYLKLFRGISNSFVNAIEVGLVTGTRYVDSFRDDQIMEYFYWIQMVSVNGTEMSVIGPASATPFSSIADIIEALTGEIDAGLLSQELREQIDLLDVLRRDIAQEVLDRILANENMAEALAAVQLETGEAATYIRQEIIERRDADSALIESINVMAAGMAGNAAAILEEQRVRVTADESLAEDIDALYAETGSNAAAILHEQQVRTTQDSALASSISSLVSQVSSNSAAIQTEASARAAADGALATQVNSVLVKSIKNGAAISTETSARISADTALSSQITTAQSVLNENIASVRTNLQTNINNTTNTMNAMYTAKVDVNGLVGGFGMINDGKTVEAGFDVDKFWIGRTTNKVKPFIIDNGVVYINKAMIKQLTADQIDTRGLTIKDQYGKIIFGAGTAVPASLISGLGDLATQDAVTSSQVSGLGALADQDSVSYAQVTGTKPPANATAGAEIGGTTGNNVKIWNGTSYVTLKTSDFVHSLAKISSNNISTFMESAAIGNAYIGNAAVNTLKIAGEAVTIPRGANGDGQAKVTLTTTESITFTIVATFTQGSGMHGYTWMIRRQSDGESGPTILTAEKPIQETLGAMTYVVTVPAGTHAFQIICEQTEITNPSTTNRGRCGITVLGCKR